MRQTQKITVFNGGLDLITPPIAMPEGSLIGARNYESVVQGYRRIEGNERFDGRPSPSSAAYHILKFDAGSTQISAGDMIQGAASSASAITLFDATIEAGSYVSGDATGSIVIFNLAGNFVDDEPIQVSASTVATTNGQSAEAAAPDDITDATYRQAAIAGRRAAIVALPGSGPVRGVHTFGDDVYGFRDNADATKCAMLKATTSGWIEVSASKEVTFSGGSTEVLEGHVTTGATSGASGTVSRVIVTSGSWTSNDAKGSLVFASLTGSFISGEAINVSGGSVATTATASGDVIIPAGGTVKGLNHNFYGLTNRYSAYLASSMGFAFEFDGALICPIRTGITAALDLPRRVAVQNNHLLLGYDGGAVMYSGTGTPLSFLAIDGAGEFSLGEDITDFMSNTETTTLIFGKNRIGYLTGSSALDFSLQIITDSSGAKESTAVMLDQPVFMDDQGVRSLSTSQNFGDWSRGAITRQIQPFIEAKKAAGYRPIGAHRVRAKDQYRLYFSDGSIISIYFGRKNPEALPSSLTFMPSIVTSGEDSTGAERIFIGGDDGFVYQADMGTSHDGAAIDAYLRFPFMHMGAPNRAKRFHSAKLDITTENTSSVVGIYAEYSNGDPDFVTADTKSKVVPGVGGFWDEAQWDKFIWSAPVQSRITVDLQGIGENISILLASNTATENPHTISSMTMYFTPRRELR